MVKFGQRVVIDRDEYILARVGFDSGSVVGVTLINLTSGNRWRDPIMMDGFREGISWTEFGQLVEDEDWTPVPKRDVKADKARIMEILEDRDDQLYLAMQLLEDL